MKRKSVDIDKIKTDIKQEKELYIITEKKPPTVEDYLPDYKLTYEGVDIGDEAEQMAESLNVFIKSNAEIVLQEYNSHNTEAVQEGFKRAVAICELFLRSLYLEQGE